MKVSKLMETLAKIDPDLEVVVAMPDHNNDYCGAEFATVEPYIGEVGFTTEVVNSEDAKNGEYGDEPIKYCLVIS